nr:uncharacterized protein LOC117844243 [Setaria viridis]
MSARGYKIIQEKYYLQTGLKHERRQLRNRIGGLKILYVFWKSLWTNSGLGRDSDGNVVASEEWWDTNTKGRKWECKKLKYGAPDYIDQLEEIFHECAVDGSTAFNPLDDQEEEEEEEQEEEQEEGQGQEKEPTAAYVDSPVSISTRKRMSSTSSKSTATSPGKKSKSPIVQALDSFVSKWSQADKKQQQLMKRQVDKEVKEREEIKKCQQIAIQCGVSPSSMEFFASLSCFEVGTRREFFMNIPIDEARFLFLERWCEQQMK